MYLRIINRLDIDMLVKSEIVNHDVLNRVSEQIETLDEAYGAYRSSRDMGGYVLLFLDEDSYNNSIGAILEFYKIDESLYEYSDCIAEEILNKVEWMEELYMLGSDDALVLIHPKSKEV